MKAAKYLLREALGKLRFQKSERSGPVLHDSFQSPQLSDWSRSLRNESNETGSTASRNHVSAKQEVRSSFTRQQRNISHKREKGLIYQRGKTSSGESRLELSCAKLLEDANLDYHPVWL